jgi:heme exporter protein D
MRQQRARERWRFNLKHSAQEGKMDLPLHAGFIISAYAVAAAVVGLLVTWVIADHLTQKRALAELDRRGITRRSAEPRPS